MPPCKLRNTGNHGNWKFERPGCTAGPFHIRYRRVGLHHGVAAADAQSLSRNKAGGIRCQEYYCVGDFVSLAHAPENVCPLDPLQNVIGENVPHLVPHAFRADFLLVRRHYQAGADYVQPQPMPARFPGDGLAQSDDPALAGGIGPPPGILPSVPRRN